MISASLIKELREKTGAGMLDCKKALEETNGDISAASDWLREKGISASAKKADRIAAEGIAEVKVDGNKAVIVEVNSETDFVAKNEEFISMVEEIMNAILSADVSTIEEAMTLSSTEGTIEDLFINRTSKIGEKLSFRRFEVINKKDNESFGEYIHMGGKIAVLTLLEGPVEVAKDVAMHAAAMRPLYVRSDDVPADELEKEKNIMREQLINEGKPADKLDNIMVGKVKKYYEDVCLEEQIFVKAENKETVGKYVSDNNASIVTMIRYEVGEGMEKREDNFAEEVAEYLKA